MKLLSNLFKCKPVHKLTNADIMSQYRTDEFYLMPSDFLGAFSYWVTTQLPESNAIAITRPAIDSWNTYARNLFDNPAIPQKFTFSELNELITEDVMWKMPNIMKLNELDDFIDLGALARNVLFMICRLSINDR